MMFPFKVGFLLVAWKGFSVEVRGNFRAHPRFWPQEPVKEAAGDPLYSTYT